MATGAVTGAVVVAPRGARWALRAATLLRDGGYHVARVPDERAVGLLLATGLFRIVLRDHRIAPPAWPPRDAHLQAMAPSVRVLVICEDGELVVEGARAWPDDAEAVWELLTSR